MYHNPLRRAGIVEVLARLIIVQVVRPYFRQIRRKRLHPQLIAARHDKAMSGGQHPMRRDERAGANADLSAVSDMVG